MIRVVLLLERNQASGRLVAKARKKEGRLRRHWRVAGELREDPKRATPLLREAVVNVWRSRGGGLYGLGYIVAFLIFEVQFVLTEVGESQGVVDFVSSQLIEYLLRFGLQSIINVFLALLWPLHVIDAFGVWGIVALIVAFLGFERLLRPTVERHFPELRKQGPKKNPQEPKPSA
ncbi:MAG: hypothetical protein V3R27_06450 [Pseudomonadales bacterium]